MTEPVRLDLRHPQGQTPVEFTKRFHSVAVVDDYLIEVEQPDRTAPVGLVRIDHPEQGAVSVCFDLPAASQHSERMVLANLTCEQLAQVFYLRHEPPAGPTLAGRVQHTLSTARRLAAQNPAGTLDVAAARADLTRASLVLDDAVLDAYTSAAPALSLRLVALLRDFAIPTNHAADIVARPSAFRTFVDFVGLRPFAEAGWSPSEYVTFMQTAVSTSGGIKPDPDWAHVPYSQARLAYSAGMSPGEARHLIQHHRWCDTTALSLAALRSGHPPA